MTGYRSAVSVREALVLVGVLDVLFLERLHVLLVNLETAGLERSASVAEDAFAELSAATQRGNLRDGKVRPPCVVAHSISCRMCIMIHAQCDECACGRGEGTTGHRNQKMSLMKNRNMTASMRPGCPTTMHPADKSMVSSKSRRRIMLLAESVFRYRYTASQVCKEVSAQLEMIFQLHSPASVHRVRSTRVPA